MKRIAALTIGLLVIAGGTAWGEDASSGRTISVTGTVVTKTAPDQVVWHIALRDTNAILSEAKTSNDNKARRVVGLREGLALDERDIETGHVSIRREYKRDAHGNQGDFKHFVVRRSITIRQNDLKRFDEFLDTLVTSADMEVNFSFVSSRINDVRAETRLKALAAARDKASAMAEVVDAKLGRVLTINEHPNDGRRFSGMSNSIQSTHWDQVPVADLATERFVPGAIDVSVTVYAMFELE